MNSCQDLMCDLMPCQVCKARAAGAVEDARGGTAQSAASLPQHSGVILCLGTLPARGLCHEQQQGTHHQARHTSTQGLPSQTHGSELSHPHPPQSFCFSLCWTIIPALLRGSLPSPGEQSSRDCGSFPCLCHPWGVCSEQFYSSSVLFPQGTD